jgi:D-alanyl-lipoteichoic acid acyltransferase DltB (MBOAT superfamily)
MNFNSPEFLLFLLGVVAVNYFLPQRFRSIFLLIASTVFIGYYNFESLLTVLISSAFNFYISRKVPGNRLLYISGVILNSYAIIMFNYFFAVKHGFDFSYTVITFNINSFIIALGLSFYSLQNISYLTEVYFKRWQPESSIKNYVLYNAFFPRIMSGPVMTPGEFMPQIDRNIISSDKLISGFNRLLLGLLKKMVIADRLAPAVHSVFDFGDTYSGLTTLLGVYLFTIQLYFDFSGYTDMALGIGRMLGYDLKENFNFPLKSASVSEFWRRWHISLISWFTNYIYYPIAYKLRSYKKAAALTGILVTFLVSGIWHGIGYTFLFWAVCHIIYLSFELLTKNLRTVFFEKYTNRFIKLVLILLVFNAVCFSNIFFRSQSLAQAFHIIKGVFNGFLPEGRIDLVAPLAIGGHQIDEFNFYISIFLMTVFLLFERRIMRFGSGRTLNAAYIIICFLLIFLFGIINSGERFIYMQF